MLCLLLSFVFDHKHASFLKKLADGSSSAKSEAKNRISEDKIF